MRKKEGPGKGNETLVVCPNHKSDEEHFTNLFSRVFRQIDLYGSNVWCPKLHGKTTTKLPGIITNELNPPTSAIGNCHFQPPGHQSKIYRKNNPKLQHTKHPTTTRHLRNVSVAPYRPTADFSHRIDIFDHSRRPAV